MCTLVILNHTLPNLPVLLGANRDEFRARSTGPTQVLARRPRVIGGLDRVAGGTWMGATESGFFVGLTNQRAQPDPTRASRGAVVTALLLAGSTPAARAWLKAQPLGHTNPYNLVFGDATELVAAYARDDGLSFEPVPHGVHVLPNGVLNDPGFPKVERARSLAAAADWRHPVAEMFALLADDKAPENLGEMPEFIPAEWAGPLHSLQVRLPAYGTRTSAVVGLAKGRVTRYQWLDRELPGAQPVDVQALINGDLGHRIRPSAVA